MAGIDDVNRHPIIHTWSYKLAEVIGWHTPELQSGFTLHLEPTLPGACASAVLLSVVTAPMAQIADRRDCQCKCAQRARLGEEIKRARSAA